MTGVLRSYEVERCEGDGLQRLRAAGDHAGHRLRRYRGCGGLDLLVSRACGGRRPATWARTRTRRPRRRRRCLRPARGLRVGPTGRYLLGAERRTLPDDRRVAAGADRRSDGGRRGAASSRSGGRRGSTRSGSTCCARPTPVAVRTARPGTASRRSPHPATSRRPTRRISRAPIRMLRLAAERYGFVVVLDPAETGGWLNTMVSKRRREAARVRPLSRSPLQDVPEHRLDARQRLPVVGPDVRPVRHGGRARHGRRRRAQLQTVELNYLVSGSLDDAAWAPLIDINASYTYEPTYRQVLKDYNRSNFLPTFMVEASYDPSRTARTRPAPRSSCGARSTGRC